MGTWFETGNKMADGTPRTVYADGQIAIDEALKKRWKPVAKDDGKDPEAVQGTKVPGVTGATTRKVGPAHEVLKNDLQNGKEDLIVEEPVVEEPVVEEPAEELTEKPVVEEPAEELTEKPVVVKSKRGKRKKS